MKDGEPTYNDWVFINYTFKRFEGYALKFFIEINIHKEDV
jgi:hypothetical protein